MANSKGVVCYTPDGEYVSNYKSAVTAALKVGVSSQAIYQAMRTKGLCAGYRWLHPGETVSGVGSSGLTRGSPVRIARYDASGNFISEHPSIRDAARAVCGDAARLSDMAKTGRLYKNCYWKFLCGSEKPQSGITPRMDDAQGVSSASYLVCIPAHLNSMSVDRMGEYAAPFYFGGVYPSLRQVALEMDWPLSAVRWAVENKHGRYYTKDEYGEPKMVRDENGDLTEQYFMIVKAPERSVLENIAESNSSFELDGYERKGAINPAVLRAAEEAAACAIRSDCMQADAKAVPDVPAPKTESTILYGEEDDYESRVKVETDAIRELGDREFQTSGLAAWWVKEDEPGIANAVARELGLDWNEVVAQRELIRRALASQGKAARDA